MKDLLHDFDERFCRRNAQTGEYVDTWYTRDDIVAKDIKSYITDIYAPRVMIEAIGIFECGCTHCHERAELVFASAVKKCLIPPVLSTLSEKNENNGTD